MLYVAVTIEPLVETLVYVIPTDSRRTSTTLISNGTSIFELSIFNVRVFF